MAQKVCRKLMVSRTTNKDVVIIHGQSIVQRPPRQRDAPDETQSEIEGMSVFTENDIFRLMNLTEASPEELIKYLKPDHLRFLSQQKVLGSEVEEFLKTHYVDPATAHSANIHSATTMGPIQPKIKDHN